MRNPRKWFNSLAGYHQLFILLSLLNFFDYQATHHFMNLFGYEIEANPFMLFVTQLLDTPFAILFTKILLIGGVWMWVHYLLQRAPTAEQSTEIVLWILICAFLVLAAYHVCLFLAL